MKNMQNKINCSVCKIDKGLHEIPRIYRKIKIINKNLLDDYKKYYDLKNETLKQYNKFNYSCHDVLDEYTYNFIESLFITKISYIISQKKKIKLKILEGKIEIIDASCDIPKLRTN